MSIYKKTDNKLAKIKEKSNFSEKEIQEITENNLDEIFNLEYVFSQFSLNNLRIDTLCFDAENKSFVVIEYKKDRSFSVIDQGFAYLALMLNNKAEFLLEYNEKTEKHLNRNDINWSESKVIFISPFFTSHQIAAINFKNLPIELWEIKYYEDNLVEYEKIEPLESSENIKTITGGDKLIKEVVQNLKTYDLESHLKRGSEKTRNLFSQLKEKILELGEIKENYRQLYVSYKADDSYISFCQIHFYKEKLLVAILIEDKKLIDSKKWIKKAPKSYGWAKNCKFFNIKSEKDIKYAMDLIEQSYEFNKNR